VHAAHRVADDEAHALEAEPLGEEAMLQVDHVLGIVLREFHLEPVGGLRRAAVADRVRQDDEKLLGIERLPLAKQLASKSRRQHRVRRAGGTV
jgi:hypothetical protein